MSSMAKPRKRPVLIGIAGGSGSGKTHLARRVQEGAGEDCVAVLSMDQYFRREGADNPRRVNFDHPAHIDFRQMLVDLRALKRGRSVMAPTYDFATMRQSPRSVRVHARKIVLVEGLFVLAEPIVKLFDLTCFLDVAPDQRLLGRILRDLEERNADIAAIVDRYQRFVRPAYDVFVAPTMHNADVVVDFTYRRALFSEMLTHIARDYVTGDLDIEPFLDRVRREAFHIGYRPEDGAMPISVDIFKLAKAFPPSMIPGGIPEEPAVSPRLFIKGGGARQP